MDHSVQYVHHNAQISDQSKALPHVHDHGRDRHAHILLLCFSLTLFSFILMLLGN